MGRAKCKKPWIKRSGEKVKMTEEKKYIILVNVLILILVIIVIWQYNVYLNDKEIIEARESGHVAGFQEAINQIASQAAACQQIPLRMDDQTITIIALECLPQ